MGRLLLFFLTFFYFSSAHQLWIEKGQSGFVLHYGHRKAAEGEKKFIEYSAENIKRIICIKNGSQEILHTQFSYPLTIPQKCDVIQIDFSTGYWTKTVNGTVNTDKNSAKSPIFSWYSYESVIYINRWNKNILLSDGLYIWSLKNPLKAKVGEKLRLKLFFDGKPVSDVPVAYDGKVLGLTDKDGRINIRVKHKGLQHIEATFRKKVNTKKADYIVYTTTLNFEVR